MSFVKMMAEKTSWVMSLVPHMEYKFHGIGYEVDGTVLTVTRLWVLIILREVHFFQVCWKFHNKILWTLFLSGWRYLILHVFWEYLFICPVHVLTSSLTIWPIRHEIEPAIAETARQNISISIGRVFRELISSRSEKRERPSCPELKIELSLRQPLPGENKEDLRQIHCWKMGRFVRSICPTHRQTE